MTIRKTYMCDLCLDHIKPTEYAAKDGFGVHFVHGGAFVFKRVTETEHHVCHQCAKSMHDELRKITPSEIPT